MTSRLALVLLLLLVASHSHSEPVFNLADTEYEEESRRASIQLLESIGLIYDALILIERNALDDAAEVLANSRSKADQAVETYKSLQDKMLSADSTAEIATFDLVLSEHPEFSEVLAARLEAEGIEEPTSLDEVVALGVEALLEYRDSLEVELSDPPYFDLVAPLNQAIERVMLIGTLIPQLTADRGA
jgi:hypothetical protein